MDFSSSPSLTASCSVRTAEIDENGERLRLKVDKDLDLPPWLNMEQNGKEGGSVDTRKVQNGVFKSNESNIGRPTKQEKT
ncbi:hypothetical protein F8388_016998 [Cannabis sativa]|uniref:Uncharacterized protein n=1 Tax=Cannabis sativa TaxID=3483 RepID=A0A7J6GCJ0_CANSA|nr:hypothetical protein F8388_016998 [Cannabis sativa]